MYFYLYMYTCMSMTTAACCGVLAPVMMAPTAASPIFKARTVFF